MRAEIKVCLPTRLHQQLTDHLDWCGYGKRTIHLQGCEVRTKSEFIQRVVTYYASGGWGKPDPAEDSSEAADATLKLHISIQEAQLWRAWVQQGLAASYSQLCRLALIRYFHSVAEEHSRYQKLFHRIQELGRQNQLAQLRTLSMECAGDRGNAVFSLG